MRKTHKQFLTKPIIVYSQWLIVNGKAMSALGQNYLLLQN